MQDTLDDPLPRGGFFPVSLNVVGRRCVVIGNDREALEKEEALREAGADVVRIADPAAVRDDEIAQAFFVISTPQNAALSVRLRAIADEHRVLLCCIDQPRYGFVAMQAIVKAGPARVAISTGGNAPRIGKVMKEALQSAMDATFARFLECVATQKRRNRGRIASGSARRAAMIAAADGFEMTVRVRYPTWFEDELARARPKPERAEIF